MDARGIVRVNQRARVTAGLAAEFQDVREFNRSEFNFGTPASPDTVQVSSDPPFAASRRDVGGYGQAVIDIGARSLLNLGARIDDNQRFRTHFTYRAGAVYALLPGLRLRGSVGSSFKEPSIRQNYAQTAFEVGNPDLKPEQSRSWEVGVEQTLARGTVVLSANYFDQRFRNLIQYNGSAPRGTPTYQNVARATSRGVEVVVDVRPVRHTTVTASYTWLKTRVDDAGFSTGAGEVFVNGKALIRRPTHNARVDGRTRLLDRVGLGVAANYVGRRADVDFRPAASVRTTLPAYVTLDADAALDLLRERSGRVGLTATLRAENLLDRSYETVVGFPGRRRAIFAGLVVGL
jgi:vitamin B12 transporter